MNTVLLEKRDAYAIVTLNRPQQMNALSRQLRADFLGVLGECAADDTVRVIILTGAGKAFCAGFDLDELSASDTNAFDAADNAMARAMEAFKGPIIGAINGPAITGGFEMALACDILIASENARFADTHARVGILPGWGLSQKLPRLIGLYRAREISFTARPVSAAQAYEWGLVNHVVPANELLDKACAMAKAMCACVPQILEQYKALIEDGYSMPYIEALHWEEQQSIESAKRTFAAMIASRREGVMQAGREENDNN